MSGQSERSELAAALGRLGKGVKKTMSPEALAQRRAAIASRWKPKKNKRRRTTRRKPAKEEPRAAAG